MVKKAGLTTKLSSLRAGVLAGVGAIGAFVMINSCTVNPATGERELSFMSREDERKIGAEAHPQLLEQFGGPIDNANVAGYVATVGGRMSANSELADENFTFTTLNSKIVNAFALPGGYVYISRGLLAIMNDESELASVLGHEVGHVTARHAAQRQTQSTLGGLLGLGVGIATGSGQLAQVAMQGAQVYLMSYSRKQEFQADELGVRYMTRAGYSPYGAPRMLQALGDHSSLEARIMGREEAERVPSWARTHPLTEDRVERALDEARSTGMAPGQGIVNDRNFLNAIDGLLYDDDPEQGVIRDTEFWHPELMFMYEVPDGFVLQNGTSAVLADGPGSAAILFSGAKPQTTDMTQHAQAIWSQMTNNRSQLSNLERISINGMDAGTGTARLDGQGGSLDVRVVAIQFDADTAYHFLFLSDPQQTRQLGEAYRRTTYSFRKISQEEASSITPRRLRVVTVQRGDTASGLASRMAYENYQLERFMVLNGLEDPGQLRSGQRVKIVVLQR